ncbi:uncharacterized protein LOC127708065 [Mytilus californianus]|uniref:uncharacterized protein LOC127708065 n=1 Tax=Mytilus californianus TaxID=6549 RepID=UPI002246160B|nr:uncharacterized protein LOC127708065 [Mytilus californianus]
MSALRSVVLLPFTAGRVIGRHGRKSQHDGSLSSVVMLTVIFALTSANIVVTVYEPIEPKGSFDMTYILLMSLQSLGLLSCICLPILLKTKIIISEKQEVKPAIKIRLFFLCIFAFGGLFHISTHLACNMSGFMIRHNHFFKSEIICDILGILYYPVQTVVVVVLVQYQLKPSVLVHYLLIFQIGTYISFWNYYLLQGLRAPSKEGLSIHENCGNNTDIIELFNSTEPFLAPTVIAFTLMVVLLLASTWPVTTLLQALPISQLSVDNNEETQLIVERSPENMPTGCREISKKSSFAFLCGIFINIPLLIFTCLYDVHSTDEIKLPFYIIALISKIILFVAISRGYMLIPKDCKVLLSRVKIIAIANCLLIFGLWGMVFFECLNFISVYNEDWTEVKLVYLLQNILASLTALQLTIFLLQMKHYEKRRRPLAWSSIEMNCIFLVGFLLVYWIIDTFIASHNLISTTDTATENSILTVMGRIVFPFVLFFRFQCILQLYEIYKIFGT